MVLASALLSVHNAPVAAVLRQEEDGGGGLLGSLGITWLGLLWQLLAFLLLLFVLQRYAFRPITRMLDERARRIRESIETAERVQREMADMEQRSRGLLEESRRESQQIIGQAQQAASRIQDESRESARRQSEEIVARAQVEIDRERNEAFAGLRREVADLAISAASRVVRRELDPQTHIQLINDTLAETASQSNGRSVGAEQGGSQTATIQPPAQAQTSPEQTGGTQPELGEPDTGQPDTGTTYTIRPRRDQSDG